MASNALERLVESNKLPVLFIGSGISKRYLYNYPDWNELLEIAFKKYNSDIFQLQKYKESFLRQGYSTFEINTKLATIIENDFNAAFFDRKIKLNIGNNKNPNWVRKGISPFKMYLSSYFKKMKLYRRNDLNLELDKFKLLKSKISAIITTNYDLFLENEIFPNDYSIFVNQSDLFGSDSYNIAEIYKIHGSATDASSIVITEDDYMKFNESRKLLIAKMLTLFSESPIVFLGYSFTDENIQNIIVDFLSCLSLTQLENIREHFIFISYKKGERKLVEIHRTITTQSGEDIPITEISTDNFGLVYDILNQITPGVSPIKIRETKRVIKTIVDANIASAQAESVIIGLDDLTKIDLSSKPLAIAIGYKENILSKFGYGLFEDDLIFEDILYNNKNFNPDSMCIDRFKSLAYTRLLPVFKYVKNSSTPIIPGSKLDIYISKHDSIEKIISKNIEKTINALPIYTDYTKLMTEINSNPNVQKKSGLLLKNLYNLTNEQIRSSCKEIFEYNRDEAMKSTHFKRCVMYLDLKENH
ncbi:SIR2 family protein [[Ruminococcus] gnavus]|jgi:hypothetical protein|uniref:SIR2 family protein n=1 Tax=Mediterraneibacter gnavus TaxID=33038 RepID=A0A415S7D3_MEDGN|nr:SIR2 family protein [Mediterraneibacter gnavus]MDU2007165.1 SIR2 family protein [Lachnospiraceae bacterium]DAM15461.1 MAG TPA: SIR2 family protein [Caudoviricetes sp.]MDB8680660.1 SIR2 family protein [Mediterraneibacter gnavus]MDB8687722.1 SIR2 family protein [Mediterraneibacter gnavus]MDB8691816.1 SIR2 family protein [Mediterraneibacter gnavus]